MTPRTVLVVEDNWDLREEMVLLLRQAGFRAQGVGDGEEALSFMREVERPALVLLDLRMPRMDGRRFRDEQRRDPRIADVPVIVITTDPAPAAADFDALAWMNKPFDIEGLLSLVASHCPPAAAPAQA